MKIRPRQKHTRVRQLTCFKAFVVVGDSNGHSLGVKCAKEVVTAIHGAIILASLSVVRSIVPVGRGY
jgi:small subunit ribosomal protein S2e